MDLQFFGLTQGNQDAERHRAAIAAAEPCTRPNLAKHKVE